MRQIAQETIPEAVRGKVNGQWRSMIAFFEMSAYAIAAYIPGMCVDVCFNNLSSVDLHGLLFANRTTSFYYVVNKNQIHIRPTILFLLLYSFRFFLSLTLLFLLYLKHRRISGF